MAGLATNGRILIIDNGSPSQPSTQSDETFIYLSTRGNIGFGAGHNALMQEAFARGADIYIAANPDGAFHHNAIIALLQMMKAHNHRALVEAIQFPVEHPKSYDPFTFETSWTSGACLAIPRQAYEELGGFDESFFMYCEDVDLSWRARANGFALRVCPRALFLHGVSNRRRDPRVLKMIFGSGVILARKWGNSKFEAWLGRELKAIGATPPDIRPKIVPDQWRWIADFNHQFSFSETRW